MFNLDDPKNQALIAMGLGLLGGAPRSNKSFGADLAHGGLLGLQAYAGAKQAQQREQEEAQQREMRAMQMAEMQRAIQQRGQISDLARQSFAPNQNLVNTDDQGFPMPSSGGGGMQQFAQGLMGIDPMMAIQMQQKTQPKFHVVGGALVPEPTMPGQQTAPVYQAPDKPQLPSGMRMGANGPEWIPGYLEGQGQVRREGRPQVSVNTNMPPLERQEQKDKGGLNVKNYGDIQTAANVARRENSLLTGIEKLNLDTNAFTPANVTVSSWVAALGGDKRFQDVASQGQGFTAFAKDLVLQRQLAQKGPQTESDAKRLEQTVVQLGNTTAANKLLVKFNKAINNRTIEQEKFYRDFWKKNKTYEGAEEAWFEGKGATSIWDEPELKKIHGPTNVVDWGSL